MKTSNHDDPLFPWLTNIQVKQQLQRPLLQPQFPFVGDGGDNWTGNCDMNDELMEAQRLPRDHASMNPAQRDKDCRKC